MIGTRLLAVCAVAVSSGCVPFHVNEWSFLSRNAQTWDALVPPGARLENVSVAQADGNVSQGVHLSVDRPVATVLLFLGNGEVVDREGATRLWQFQRLGVDAWVFDRRGYGRTSGKPFIQLLGSDAVEVHDYVRARTRGALIVHGFSLGSMQAGYVASQRNVDALVLEGSLPNAGEYVDIHMPWYLRPVFDVEISPELQQADNGKVVASFRGPLLIAVGEHDDDTFPELSRRLFERAVSPAKRLAIIPGADHYALITPAGFETYRTFIGDLAAHRAGP